jgi:hypothetical protein
MVRARTAAFLCVIALSAMLVAAGPQTASASTLVGYCYKWTPRGNAASKGRTTLIVNNPGGPGAYKVVASNSKTHFWFYAGESATTGHWSFTLPRQRVSRNKFFALARKNGEITVRVKWTWKRDSHHRRYRYGTTIEGTYYQS